ncbi:hypothetical protein FOL47_004781 [Perkinsus chesapeaki]|uniref:Peptidase A1 domain-containing protein n=1 Tax=Perkinsus chesapeaki TaxID=330153 RepID=A0A7J6M0R5_PERCH|nr:hypothetical protein FOL47_004781 [Perkinsus chesapeaki]
MTLRRLFTLITLGLFSLPSCFGAPLRLPITYTTYPKAVRGVYAELEVDGQILTMFVDTGSEYTIIIWKDWLEEQYWDGYCNSLPIGCYKSSAIGKRGDITASVRFDDDVSVAIFKHKGSVTFGGTTVDNMFFGLIYDQHPPPDESDALNILGLTGSEDEYFPSFMEQLSQMSPSPVVGDTYAIYMRSSFFSLVPSGELLLGSGDPTLYYGALSFAKMTDVTERTVNIQMFHVGSGITTIGINQQTQIDSGTEDMYIPRLYINGLIKDLSQESDVTFYYDLGSKRWFFDCRYMSDLPTITFGFDAECDARLTLSRYNYARNGHYGCSLIFAADDDNIWIFPGRALIGNYVEFQPSQGKQQVSTYIS